MTLVFLKPMKTIRFLLFIISGLLLTAATARANVYATDIKVNGSLSSVTNSGSGPVTITYRLNQIATLGVTVGIWQGATEVDTIPGGTNLGLNTVKWGVTNSGGSALTSGTYSISITAATSGFTNWQQITSDTNAANYAFFPQGLAVNCNTNSPYYGRIFLGNAYANGTATNPVNGQLILDGIYKINADGSFADEGGFGFGGYTHGDGNASSTNEMPNQYAACPFMLRVGGDDRVYMLDWANDGAIIAFDSQVTTNQIVIDDGGVKGGALGGPHSWGNNPLIGDIADGFGEFDITGAGTTNAAIWLCDNDYPNWGVMMFHMVNGASDTNDNGTQAVVAGQLAVGTSDLSLVSSGGCTVDDKLDIFVGQTRNNPNPLYYVMDFTNWNGGVLPPTNGGTNGALFYGDTNQIAWGDGCSVDVQCGDRTFERLEDVVINSRINPTLVACPLGVGNNSGILTYTTNTVEEFTTNDGVVSTNFVMEITTNDSGGGIRVLDAATGEFASFTNGSYTESLTNLGWGTDYERAAWDNVGNLYGASQGLSLWRAWSPPGPNTNTTLAVAQVILGTAAPPGAANVTSVTAAPTTPGCATVTITFTGLQVLPVSSSYLVYGSDILNGTYTSVSGATVISTGTAGTYQATFSNCSTQFYEIWLVSH
jgi:hypothetical protein